jgi:hypothetical protein
MKIEWVNKFYREDYADPNIKLALEGKVLRKVGKVYEVMTADIEDVVFE